MNRTPVLAALALASVLLTPPLTAQDAKERVVRHVERHAAEYGGLAQEIWDLAEVGYQETKSSALLQARLADAGFDVRAGVAGMPTGFVASWGSGEPVIALLAEFDALPGITQDRVPERSPIEDKPAGHACGHHLFGTASTAAALAVKDWLASSGHGGTIRLYGTPAEEGGAGKVYMVRAGLLDDVDVVLHWHPGAENESDPTSSLANKSAKFRFTGVSAHAAAAPDRGRSALDAVEAMDHMVNMMREHVPQETRIHYVITSGGSAPNVVPDFAEVYYYVRHPDPELVRSIFDRVVKAAEGAAHGTETEMTFEVIHGIYNLLPNVTLSEMVHENLESIGGVTYTPEERRFAEILHRTLPEGAPPIEAAAGVKPFEVRLGGEGGSTDVGDVSWTVPTAGMSAATWVPGTAAHSWQAVAAGGTSIGNKGMIVAAKTLATSAVELYQRPELVAKAREEFMDRRGPDYHYVSLVGDRDPPLDYRDPARPGG